MGEDNLHYEKFQDGSVKCIEDEIPFELPEGWAWCRLNSIVDVRDGTHDTPTYVDKGIPLITSKNLVEGGIDYSNVKYIVADIGSWTKDIIFIDERKVQPDKCVTVPNSIITLFQEINAAVAEAIGGRVPESVVQNFIFGKDVVIPEDVKEIIISKLKAFATDIEGMLEESGFDLAYYNILYVGGGAIIMRRFGNARENVAYLEDIRLNAKGYELLATHQMNKR